MSEPTAPAQPAVPSSLVVREIACPGPGLMLVTLARVDGVKLPEPEPGSHLDVVTPSGAVRQYSLVVGPHQPGTWLIGVQLADNSRGGSVSLHRDLRPGDAIEVRDVRNNFPLRAALRHLFIAGGIGITPIISMVTALERTGDSNWRLLYAGRSRATMTFAGWLIERYGERVEISADDERGLPDVGAFIGPADPATLVYCCGPEGLLIEAEAAMRDWPAGSMRAERFTAKPLTLPPTERSFQVELASSGRILDVLPDESILEVVRRAGVRVPSSCREGTCGTCETDVLAGVPDHRDSVLDDEERELGETMFICVSRSLTPRLTLDL